MTNDELVSALRDSSQHLRSNWAIGEFEREMFAEQMMDAANAIANSEALRRVSVPLDQILVDLEKKRIEFKELFERESKP